MKIIPFLLFLLVSVRIYAQKNLKTEQVTDHSIHITCDKFEGIVFSKQYKGRYDVYDTSEYKKNKWYTPSTADIVLTEKILVTELKKKSLTEKGRSNEEKIVFNKLKSSNRQYIGYINPQGEKLICINGFPNYEDWANEKSKDPPFNPVWYNKTFVIMDGGPSFWHITINLKTNKIVLFSVNGIA